MFRNRKFKSYVSPPCDSVCENVSRVLSSGEVVSESVSCVHSLPPSFVFNARNCLENGVDLSPVNTSLLHSDFSGMDVSDDVISSFLDNSTPEPVVEPVSTPPFAGSDPVQ